MCDYMIGQFVAVPKHDFPNFSHNSSSTLIALSLTPQKGHFARHVISLDAKFCAHRSVPRENQLSLRPRQKKIVIRIRVTNHAMMEEGHLSTTTNTSQKDKRFYCYICDFKIAIDNKTLNWDPCLSQQKKRGKEVNKRRRRKPAKVVTHFVERGTRIGDRTQCLGICTHRTERQISYHADISKDSPQKPL